MATSILDLTAQRAEDGADNDDLRLVDALRAGTAGSYEELLARFQQPVYALALRLLGDSSEAADVVQEVFLKVFRNIAAFRARSSLKTSISHHVNKIAQCPPLVLPASPARGGTRFQTEAPELEGSRFPIVLSRL